MFVGPYELVGRVSLTAAGAVWKGRDPGLFRDVALKQVSVPSAVQVVQIRSEATILASLHHGHIVQAYDLIEQGNDVWLVQEWVEGASLRAVAESNANLTPQQALGVMRGALQGLAYAHDQGVVHGDVSPENILVDDQGVSKLVDFGLAGRMGQVGGGGTPGYASPEALNAEQLVPASDVYSSAAVLAELLQGRPLFGGDDAGAVLVAQREPPVLRAVHVEIRSVLERALAADDAGRQQDAGVLLAELEIAAERAYGSGWWSTAGLAGMVGATMAGGLTVAAAGPVPATAPAPAQASAVSHSAGVQETQSADGSAGAERVVKKVARSGSNKGLKVAGAGGAVVVVVAAIFLLKGGGSAGTAAPAGQSVATSATSATSETTSASATDPALGAGNSVTLPASPTRTTVSSRTVPSKPVVPPNPALGFNGTYKYKQVLTSTEIDGEPIGRTENTTWTVKTTCVLATCKSSIASSSGRKLTLTGKSGTWTDDLGTTFGCADSVTGKQTGQILKGQYHRTLKVSRSANGRVSVLTGTAVDRPLTRCTDQVVPLGSVSYTITVTFVKP